MYVIIFESYVQFRKILTLVNMQVQSVSKDVAIVVRLSEKMPSVYTSITLEWFMYHGTRVTLYVCEWGRGWGIYTLYFRYAHFTIYLTIIILHLMSYLLN